jgi:hypothetical protein
LKIRFSNTLWRLLNADFSGVCVVSVISNVFGLRNNFNASPLFRHDPNNKFPSCLAATGVGIDSPPAPVSQIAIVYCLLPSYL